MASISDEHIEWAVVNRLKALLDRPPVTALDVTQTFALFTSLLLWTKNRAWVAGNDGQRETWDNPADQLAHDFRKAMRGKPVTADPWRLSLVRPQIVQADREGDLPAQESRINSDFENMSAEAFVRWLRNAVAHGDGRTIRPIHTSPPRTGETLLVGFRICFAAERGSERTLTLDLFHDDMRRIGSTLAGLFCRSLSGGDRYFEQDAATVQIDPTGNAT